MNRIVLFMALFLVATGTKVRAEIADLPALYNVTGLSSGEVLNVRATPNFGAEIVGTLPAGTQLKEVMAIDASGDWGQVNTGESAGWVSMKFMQDAAGPRWWARDLPLSCFGTEPFWSAVIFRNEPGSIALENHSGTTPAKQTMALGKFQRVWGNPVWDQPMNAVMNFANGNDDAIAVIRAEACNDGMSDRQYGLSINLFLNGGIGNQSYLGGCCSIGN